MWLTKTTMLPFQSFNLSHAVLPGSQHDRHGHETSEGHHREHAAHLDYLFLRLPVFRAFLRGSSRNASADSTGVPNFRNCGVMSTSSGWPSFRISGSWSNESLLGNFYSHARAPCRTPSFRFFEEQSIKRAR